MVRFHFVRMVEELLKRTTPIANKYQIYKAYQ